MTKRHLVIATRESPLAMRQTEWVKERLQKIYPHLSIEFLGIKTQGDKILNVTLSKIGGKGLFVKELEEKLLDGSADIAVHSIKDVTMEMPPGLILPVICEREDPRDAFVSNKYNSLDELPRAASVGTSSLRRQTQMLALRSDISVQNLRGNINTRLAKLDEGGYDAIILAAAGLRRMGFTNRIRSYFSIEDSLPAAGQGALGIECREDDEAMQTLIASLDHPNTHACVVAERAVCRRLGGGCSVPIAAFGEIHHGTLVLRGLVPNRDGTRMLRVKHEGDAKNPESIGLRVAEELLQQGADKILSEFE